MVDTYVSGAYGEICVGSSPISDIFIINREETELNKRIGQSKLIISPKPASHKALSWGGGALGRTGSRFSDRKTFLGFTLAEVLITLGILGIVIAMTLPSLVQKYKEKEFVTAYLRVYSILNQAYTRAIVDNETFEYWDKTSEDTYNKLKPFLNLGADCSEGKSNAPCGFTVTSYKLLNDSFDNTDFSHFAYYNYPSIKLNSGESIMFLGSSGHDVDFLIDLNGEKNPNKFGEDAHFLSFNSDSNYRQILPGAVWSNNKPNSPQGGRLQCQRSQTWFAGSACGYWILTHQNMNYLHMSDEKIRNNW